jgi:hypothetical protein
VQARLPGEEEGARWLRVDHWLKGYKDEHGKRFPGHPPTGLNAEAAKWEKQFLKLRNCQSEWIGYRAACCEGRTRPVAVPIGCNNRMCTLCAWHRSQVARVRVKQMFDRLHDPVLITLTVPNKAAIRHHDFKLFRQRVLQFVKQYDGYILGGIYSLETTYNREHGTWHVHAHVLADCGASLPHWSQKLNLFGEFGYAFNALKLRMEFDWLRLWSTRWGKEPRSNASATDIEGDRYLFENWVRKGRTQPVKTRYFDWTEKKWKSRPIEGLSDQEFARRTRWNQYNRIVLDVRRVNDREGAAKEVLKYITKAAHFCDVPTAVEQFSNATKSVRLVQTFGTWYGANFDAEFDTDHLDDWGQLKCTCGLNMWERMGTFTRADVEIDEAGRAHLRRTFDHKCRGTVARPTIRALDSPREEF